MAAFAFYLGFYYLVVKLKRLTLCLANAGWKLWSVWCFFIDFPVIMCEITLSPIYVLFVTIKLNEAYFNTALKIKISHSSIIQLGIMCSLPLPRMKHKWRTRNNYWSGLVLHYIKCRFFSHLCVIEVSREETKSSFWLYFSRASED